jgi:exopolyphosphatase/pppGpp-phosphohydrolase
MKLTSFFLNIFILTSTLSATTQVTNVVRAAIDLGMAGPKLQIAEVDPKTNKIIKILHTQRYFVNFYESITHATDHQLCSEIMTQGLIAFKDAVDMANSFKVDRIVGIATPAFRSAINGDQFANEIQNEIGIKVHIIDQNLEGILTFQAVLSKINIDTERLVVWDIGGRVCWNGI